MSISNEQAARYLASIGIALPDFMLELIVDRANTIEPCMDGAGYDAGTQTLILLYSVGLTAVVQGDRYITQQRAPNGASQSFQYGTLSQRYKSALSLLRGLDTAGCADSLIPANPEAQNAALFVGLGGCL